MNVNFRMVAVLTPAATLQEDTYAIALLLCCSEQTTSPAAVCVSLQCQAILKYYKQQNILFRFQNSLSNATTVIQKVCCSLAQ